MKDIRIFIASSKELEKERNELAFLVLAKEEGFEQRGLRVRLAKWEYVDPKMTAVRTEDRYLEEMYNCDAAMVIFKNIAGMYTREELDKALAREAAGSDRIKTHKILFSAEGKPDSDAAKLRASLPEENYGVYTNIEELKTAFLALVDEVAKSDRLVDAQDENLYEVLAFVVADDELASDRNAFADTILNLNDILARRGIRVRMRFYEPEHHRELLESSEMALVLYDTNYKAFNPDRMHDAYERTKREENPKRLYVFFRDEEESKLDQDFIEFRNGFAENLGHFFCRFENADTLKLNFLLSLENQLGEGASFVKLDGRMIKADELAVGEITNMPMVAKNDALRAAFKEMGKLSVAFDKQRKLCRENPENDDLYHELLEMSANMNAIQEQIDRDLALSLKVARRMAAVSVAEANETILCACAKMDEGDVRGALEVLDGYSNSTRRARLQSRAAARHEEEKAELLEWESFVEVDTFHVDALMSFSTMPFADRLNRSKEIYRELLEGLDDYAGARHEARLDRIRAALLVRFADLHEKSGDDISAISHLERAESLYRSIRIFEKDADELSYSETLIRLCNLYRVNRRPHDSKRVGAEAVQIRRKVAKVPTEMAEEMLAAALNDLAILDRNQNRHAEAEREFSEALMIRRRLVRANPTKYEEFVARTLNNIANLYRNLGRLKESDEAFEESLAIFRRLQDSSQRKEVFIAATLNDIALLHKKQNRQDEAEKEFSESLMLRRRLALENPAKYSEFVARTLNNIGNFYRNQGRLEEAGKAFSEGLVIFRRLMTLNAAKYEEFVAALLTGLATLHTIQGDLDVARTEFDEALLFREAQAAENPDKFNEKLAETLHEMAKLLIKTGDGIGARVLLERARELLTALVAMNAEKFAEYLGETNALLLGLA